MIKLVVSDMDGTLLNQKNTVTKENKEAIKKLQKQGIPFIVITGRDPFAMIEFEKEMGISFDALCANGACLLRQDGEIEHRHILTTNQANKIIDVFDKYDLMSTIYSDKGVLCLLTPEEYFIHLRDVMVPALRLLVPEIEFSDEKLMEMVRQTIFIKKEDLDQYRIFKILTKSIDLERLSKVKEEMKDIQGISALSTSEAYIECYAWQAQKGFALKEYAKDHKIPLEEVIAIGDNENDISMLSIPEIQSIAMGNAIEPIKEICKYETRSNRENGVAYVLNSLVHKNTILE